jgi:endoglucanase
MIFCLSSFAQTKGIPFGINICGAEFGENNLPGVLNQDYAYPSENDIEYFYQQGFQLMTIPFKWERLQNRLGGDLNQENIDEIKRVLQYCAPRNIRVILTMHNFGRYRIAGSDHVVGGNTVTRNHFTDFWIRMARALKDQKNIYGFEIMSEPHDMGPFDWFTTAQEAINGIRTIDKKTSIIVSGDNYANAEKWGQYSDVLKNLTDPSNSIIYDAHCYFDKNYSGRYAESYEDQWGRRIYWSTSHHAICTLA